MGARALGDASTTIDRNMVRLVQKDRRDASAPLPAVVVSLYFTLSNLNVSNTTQGMHCKDNTSTIQGEGPAGTLMRRRCGCEGAKQRREAEAEIGVEEARGRRRMEYDGGADRRTGADQRRDGCPPAPRKG